jgi:hypothetical protein
MRSDARRSCREHDSSLAVGRLYRPGPYQSPSLRARRAGVYPCRGPLQHLAGNAPQAPLVRVWHKLLRGGSAGPSKGEAFQKILCTGERHWQRRREGQQLGRTRHRERQGSTGKAGRSKAGERLAIRLSIDELLLCYSLGHCRHQLHRHGSIFLNIGQQVGHVNHVQMRISKFKIAHMCASRHRPL